MNKSLEKKVIDVLVENRTDDKKKLFDVREHHVYSSGPPSPSLIICYIYHMIGIAKIASSHHKQIMFLV